MKTPAVAMEASRYPRLRFCRSTARALPASTALGLISGIEPVVIREGERARRISTGVADDMGETDAAVIPGRIADVINSALLRNSARRWTGFWPAERRDDSRVGLRCLRSRQLHSATSLGRSSHGEE